MASSKNLSNVQHKGDCENYMELCLSLVLGCTLVLVLYQRFKDPIDQFFIRSGPILDPESPRKPRGILTRWLLSETHCQVGRMQAIEDMKILSSYRMLASLSGPSYVVKLRIGNSKWLVPFCVDSGCTKSTLSLQLVVWCGLVHLLDTSDKMTYEAAGGVRAKTSGILRAPVTTPSGLIVLKEIVVCHMEVKEGLLGLDVLSALNCSVIMDDKNPQLIIRERKTKCCGVCNFTNGARVKAKLNDKLMYCTLDTGSLRTLLGPRLGFETVPLPRPKRWVTATMEGLVATQMVANLRIEVNDNVGYISPIIVNERTPLIGTDFLRNMRVDFICGIAYVTKC